MAKRLPPAEVSKPPRNDHPEICVCGGNVELEPDGRPSRYPRRYVCLNCENEYGTTRPASRNY